MGEGEYAGSLSTFRVPRDSPLCRFVLHSKIENDLDGLMGELLMQKEGRLLLQKVLHAAGDAGSFDLFEFKRDPLEHGIRYFANLEPRINTYESESKQHRVDKATTTQLPISKAPFRGQMFITADMEDGRRADYVWKAEKIIRLLGTSMIPRRPHSAPRQRNTTAPTEIFNSSTAG